MAEGWMIGACGLNCARCDIYLASHGDEGKRLGIQTWFTKMRGRDIALQSIRCEGCGSAPEECWCKDCAMQRCASDRGHRHCFECEGFPCEHLREFAADGSEHHRRTVENLSEMRRLGLEEWIRRHPEPSFCP